jgi:Transposase
VSQLFAELQAQGYQGSRRQVRSWREATGDHEAEKTKTISPAPSPRQATWWLLQAAEKLAAEEMVYVQTLVQRQPELAQAQTLAQEFQRLIQQRAESDFDAWCQLGAEKWRPRMSELCRQPADR